MAVWTGYAPLTTAAANDTLLILDKSDQSADQAGTIKEIAVSDLVPAGTGGTGAGFTLGTIVSPSGGDDSAAINAALAATIPVVFLEQSQYQISAPITSSQDGATIIGVNGGWSSVSDAYGSENDGNAAGYPTGTQIWVMPTFVGESAILFDRETGPLQVGVLLRDFYLDCSAMQPPTETWSVSGKTYSGNGISIYGAVCAGKAENVTVSKAQGSCWVFDNAQGSSGSGYPDNWVITTCKASAARANGFTGAGNYPGYGFALIRCPDIVVSGCEASECYGDNWYINDVTNGMFTNNKGENGGQNGWHFVGAYGAGYYQNFVNCTSNWNGENGFLWDETSGGSGPADWNMVGCKATNDGQNGPGRAGFAANGSPDRIMLTGCFVDGTTQSYGLSFAGTCFGMIVTGGSFVKSGSQTFTPVYSTGATVTHLPTVNSI